MRKQKIVKKYFVDHPEVLEAIKREVYKTNIQVEDDDIPSFDGFLARNETISRYYKEKESRQQDNQTSSSSLNRSLKFIIPIAAVVLFGIFMAFTSPGKALADNMYKTVVQWFDNDVKIQYGASGAYSFPDDVDPEYYDTFESMKPMLNAHFVMNVQASLKDKIELTRVDASLTVIKSNYLFNSKEFMIIQTIYGTESSSTTSMDFEDAQTIDETLDNHLRFIGYVKDNAGYVVSFVDGMNMGIQVSSLSTDYNTFVDFIRGITID